MAVTSVLSGIGGAATIAPGFRDTIQLIRCDSGQQPPTGRELPKVPAPGVPETSVTSEHVSVVVINEYGDARPRNR